MKSFYPKQSDLQKKFLLLDLDGMVLGRVCAQIAILLRGKHKPTFTPGTDCGDRVIVLNSDRIVVTGKKLDDNIFYKHTGYIGNMKKRSLRERMTKDSTEVILRTVQSMLPKGPLGRKQLRSLHVFKDDKHNYTSVPIKKLETSDLRKV